MCWHNWVRWDKVPVPEGSFSGSIFGGLLETGI